MAPDNTTKVLIDLLAVQETTHGIRDSIQDIVVDSILAITRIRFTDITPSEKDKLARELQDNLYNIGILSWKV